MRDFKGHYKAAMSRRRQYHEETTMADLVWDEKYPTVQGWYWMRIDGVCQIAWINPEAPLWLIHSKHEEPQKVEFYGPLTPPA